MPSHRQRPLIAIPGRFSVGATALRYRGLVVAESLAESVFIAGGEPTMVLPDAHESAAERLGWVSGLLLPGGGDLDPMTYGQAIRHQDVYDVDQTQDAFDLAAARWALASHVPLLAICRGLQVVNVALGGTLNQHVDPPHRHFRHEVAVVASSVLAGVVGASSVDASCYHHQTLDQLATGMVAVAHAADGTVEGIERPSADGWFIGVQWHPEDTAAHDHSQRALFSAFIDAARAS